MSVDVITFGCRLNAYESEIIRRNAAGLGDAVVVNTCAVTAEAVRQARQAIRKVRRERPDARIVVTGCAAQTAPQDFADMPEVDRVLGNEEKLERRDVGRARRGAARDGLRHHGGEGAGAASGRCAGRPHPRLRAGADRLRSPLHVLHHPVRARQFALAAGGGRGGAGAAAGGQRLPRGGADRRRHHQLRRGFAGRAAARRAGQAGIARTRRRSSGCGCRRSIPSRPTPICSMRSATSRG